MYHFGLLIEKESYLIYPGKLFKSSLLGLCVNFPIRMTTKTPNVTQWKRDPFIFLSREIFFPNFFIPQTNQPSSPSRGRFNSTWLFVSVLCRGRSTHDPLFFFLNLHPWRNATAAAHLQNHPVGTFVILFSRLSVTDLCRGRSKDLWSEVWVGLLKAF